MGLPRRPMRSSRLAAVLAGSVKSACLLVGLGAGQDQCEPEAGIVSASERPRWLPGACGVGFVVMLLFCPCCGNGLIVEEGQRCHRFACNTCPYVHNITRKVGPGARRRAGDFPQASGFLPQSCKPTSPGVRLPRPLFRGPFFTVASLRLCLRGHPESGRFSLPRAVTPGFCHYLSSGSWLPRGHNSGQSGFVNP